MFTFELSVSVVARRAETSGSVGNNTAHGVDTTGAGLEARYDTAALLATFVRPAVLVLLAFVLDASDGGVPSKAGGAEADRLVVRNAAFGALTAGSCARVGALAVDASLVNGTVGMSRATSRTDARTTELSGGALTVRRALKTTAALLTRLSAAAVR